MVVWEPLLYATSQNWMRDKEKETQKDKVAESATQKETEMWSEGKAEMKALQYENKRPRKK